jgi:hypothetical protein
LNIDRNAILVKVPRLMKLVLEARRFSRGIHNSGMIRRYN